MSAGRAVLTIRPVLAVALWLAAALGAQDDVLAVERREDVRARDALMRVLKATHADFAVAAMAPRDFCRLLSARLGDKVNFWASSQADAAAPPSVNLNARALSLWSAMAIAQEQTERRFVYRCGVVFLVQKDAIKPLTYVVVYDLRAECTKLRSFPGPGLRLREPGDDRPLFPEEEPTEQTVSGFTADGIETLLKEHVTPEAWGTDAASIGNSNGLFVVRQTPEGHRQVRELLIMLGLLPASRTVAGREPARRAAIR